MSETDQITTGQLLKHIPPVLAKFPSIAKGYYYYSFKDGKKPLSVGWAVARNAEKYPTRPSLYYENRVLTHQQFNEWANRFAHYFISQGIKRGDAVALFLENRPELLAVFTGLNKVGATCTMLNTSQRGRVLEHSINLIKPQMIVVGEEIMDNFLTVKDSVELQHPQPLLYLADNDTLTETAEAPEGFVNLADAIKGMPSSNPILNVPVTADDYCAHLFTSGTTGLPKATPCTNKKWLKAYGGFGHMSLSMKPQDVIYVTLPFYHGTALFVCWGAAVAGGSAIAMRRKFSVNAFWDDVRLYNATCIGYIGELCRYLMNQPASPQDRQHKVTKMVGNGLRPSIWKAFKQRFGIEHIAELYGSSEGNIGFTNLFNFDNTVGFSTAPFALVRYHEDTREPVRNGDGRLEKVKDGEPGLLLGEITDKWPFDGYTQADATNKVVIRDAFENGDAWFNTGDLLRNIGFRHLQFVDRMGDTFRWKGENVSTTQVENLFDELGDVQETIVYGVEIPNTNGKAGMATVVLKPGVAKLDTQKLLAHLRDSLPPYAVPLFIRVADEVSKTGTFKYQKTDLKKVGFDISQTDDPVYVLLPKANGYTRLTADALKAIQAGDYRF